MHIHLSARGTEKFISQGLISYKGIGIQISASITGQPVKGAIEVPLFPYALFQAFHGSVLL